MWMNLKRLLLVLLALYLGGCALSREETAEPPAELVDIKQEFRLEKVWSKGLGGDGSNLRLGLQPASDNARIYAGSRSGDVYAFNQSDGKAVWRQKTRLPLAAGPGLGEDVLALGSSDGDLVALDKNTGDILWQKTLSSEIVAPPLIARGIVVVRTVDGFLRGLDAASGEQSWQVQFEVPRLSLRGNAPPIMYGTVVIAGFDNGKVAAVSAANGAIAWQATLAQPRGRTELERMVDVDARPVLVGEDLYLAGYQGRVVLVRPASGQLVWSQDMSSYSGMAADWNLLFVTDENSEVIGLDRKSGIEVWRNKQMRARALTAPAVFGDSIVVGDFEGYLHFLSRETGDYQARIRVGKEAIATPPLVLDAGLAVQTSGGQLTVLRRK